MTDHKITLEDILRDANKVGDFQMQDDGRVTGRFRNKKAMQDFMTGNLEFYWCTQSVAVAYNAKYDYVIVAKADSTGAGTSCSFLIHGLHDWSDLMTRLHTPIVTGKHQ